MAGNMMKTSNMMANNMMSVLFETTTWGENIVGTSEQYDDCAFSCRRRNNCAEIYPSQHLSRLEGVGGCSRQCFQSSIHSQTLLYPQIFHWKERFTHKWTNETAYITAYTAKTLFSRLLVNKMSTTKTCLAIMLPVLLLLGSGTSAQRKSSW